MRDTDEECFRLIVRLVGLIHVPRSSWTSEDEVFFRNVRDEIQQRRGDGDTTGEFKRKIQHRDDTD